MASWTTPHVVVNRSTGKLTEVTSHQPDSEKPAGQLEFKLGILWLLPRRCRQGIERRRHEARHLFNSYTREVPMNRLSRPSACVIAVLVLSCHDSALSQESEPVAPAGEGTDSQTAPASSESEGPVRPKRGKAPTADRIGGATVDINPDGTMTRRTEVLGRTVEGAEAPAAEGASDSDPSQQLPERATVSSVNEESPIAEHPATTAEGPMQSSNYMLLAAAGACVVAGIVLWLTMRRSQKV